MSPVFQSKKEHRDTVFDIAYYKAFKKYLLLLGQYPNQSRWSRRLNQSLMVLSLVSLAIPAFSQLFVSIFEKSLEGSIEAIPIIMTLLVCMIKLLNHSINKDNFDKLFELMKEEWELLKANNESFVLDDVTKKGNKLAEVYRTTLLSFAIAFLFLPLSPSVLDTIVPLNETRPRQLLFKLKYFVDEDEYFYRIYFHSAWCVFVIIVIVISIDSLYMLVVHHCCGLFAAYGYRVKRTIEHSDVDENGMTREQLKQLVITHQKYLQFYEVIDDSSRNSYFLQVGLNMIGITVTAVQTVAYLDQPEETTRLAVFLIAQQFHLFVISVPGQVLTDYSLGMMNDIYDSMWYKIPVSIQKMLHIVQIRSCQPCKLTAGGLYEMNIENFGATLKTCVSYFTVLLSVRG